ncbi:MobF family relaxase [Tardiphaga sp.]|uniref:MobF family relaxase n=1 Tax=Tardiphaga sp. TaxID=1926292 RepID=UPI00352AE764
MVATWNPAAASTYYTRQRETEYYDGSSEPAGQWYAPAGDLGVIDGSQVDRETFERLYHAIDKDGQSLVDKVRRHKERTPAFDITLSTPRSVSLVWAFASYDTKCLIEAAQLRAARATLRVLEREAAWARRGKDGAFLEKVAITSGTFQHGESRPTEHADGRVFGDPNLHTHCVVLNIATRKSDFTVGGLHSKLIRDFKMAAGATYHAALAHELQTLGFAIDRTGKNGVFEIAGVGDEVIRYFSARRQEIEAELAGHGVVSSEATALAAAIAKATRSAKRQNETVRRQEIWAEAARSIGIDVDTFTENLRDPTPTLDRQAAERLLSERLAALPVVLSEHDSVIERRELLRSVTAAFVGTGLPAERAEVEVARLLQDGAVIEIGRDALGLPCYSTPEIIAIEREVVEQALALARHTWHGVDLELAAQQCNAAGLNVEQTEAVLGACGDSAISIIEGAPGSGKTTTLSQIVSSYSFSSGSAGARSGKSRDEGRQSPVSVRCIATAAAWRIANNLATDLGIESRATASWIAMLNAGHRVLDEDTLLIVDEAGLLSSRQMHALLGAVVKAGAKAILVGDRRQIQPIGGPGLDLVSRAVEAVRVDTIVRQREAWAREAISSFGKGNAAAGLKAFAERGLLIEAQGAKAAIASILDAAEGIAARDSDASVLILAKSNAAVTAVSRVARERRKAAGLVKGCEVSFAAATPSGHTTQISLAAGDQIRFLARNDDLGVINGTIGTVTKVSERGERGSDAHRVRIEAEIAGRRVTFDPSSLADVQGRARLGWAYASTIYGSQGLTVDHTIVYLDQSYNRHDIYVAASRAREQTTLVVEANSIDRRLAAELPFDQQRDDVVFSDGQRRTWLAERLSRASPKISTLDVIERVKPLDRQAAQVRQQRRELSHEL